ncbi:MAG: polysaccharide pyruvyl transferase family protein [Syntrophorhabdales bacterium]|jgi:GR25 family glycosyltransferase involved in LPS biosynthesis
MPTRDHKNGIEEFNARHSSWVGTLVLNHATGRLLHRESKSTASFSIDGDILSVNWDRFLPETFYYSHGEFIYSTLAELSTSLPDIENSHDLTIRADKFNVPVYVTHYTPLLDRKSALLEQFQKAGIERFRFIESMDREAIGEAETAYFYAADPEKWAKMFAKTRTLFIEANQWRPDKKSWAEGISDDGKFMLPFKIMSMGELSLCCKHAEALRLIAENDDPYAIIFEDDVVLVDDFKHRFVSSLADTPQDWDIIFLGSAFWHKPPERNSGKLSYKMEPPRGKCSDSYMVTPKTARLLLDHMVPFTQPMDWELIYWMNELQLNCFWWEPPIVTQGSQSGKFNSSLYGDVSKPVIIQRKTSIKKSRLFGLLTYNNTDNIGDEIQSIATKQFLPSVDYQLDRDTIGFGGAPPDDDVRLILNGWFMYCRPGAIWPLPEPIRPLITSFHLTPAATDFVLSEEGVKFLRRYGPVGCRDLYTLGVMRRHGVESFFSACMTLTLERPEVARDDNLIVVNDVSTAVEAAIAGQTVKRIVSTTHSCRRNASAGNRFESAQALLRLYAQASCVVTTRLHCAFPCLAMNTPVLLIRKSPDATRFSGLETFLFNCREDDLISDSYYYDFENPISNPGTHIRYRQALVKAATDFVRL